MTCAGICVILKLWRNPRLFFVTQRGVFETGAMERGGKILTIKTGLIMQSFAPLFLILAVKFWQYKLVLLAGAFGKMLLSAPGAALHRICEHPLRFTAGLELLCIGWIIIALWYAKQFRVAQMADFISQGEALKEIEKMPDVGVSFFMTYLLPLAMDDLDTEQGLIVFLLIMGMLLLLMKKTNLYYQNPVLTILGYETFSFQFDTTQETAYQGKQFVGITRGTAQTGKSIKRKKIADNVFWVYGEQ